MFHPDINPHRTEQDKEVWWKARSLFREMRYTDLMELRDKWIPNAPNTEDEGIPTAYVVTEMQKKIDVLQAEIDRMVKEFPYVLEEKILDSEWIQSEKFNLKKKKDYLVRQRIVLDLELMNYR